jgi:hypothetical protein
MLQGEHRRDRNAVLTSQPDLNLVSHTFEQVLEPRLGLWKHLVPSASALQKPVEFVQEPFRAPHFTMELFPFCPVNLPSKGIMVQPMKDVIQAWP